MLELAAIIGGSAATGATLLWSLQQTGQSVAEREPRHGLPNDPRPSKLHGGSSLTKGFQTVKSNTVVWKKLYRYDMDGSHRREFVAKLVIPAGATVYKSGDYGRAKCRASHAYVVQIENKTARGSPAPVDRANGGHDENFAYEEGSWVIPRDDFDMTAKTCSSGIHFYEAREDARYH